MCGIVGVVTKAGNGFMKREEDAFFEMLYTDALRGFDSTGLIGVENDGTFHIMKEAVEATVFIPQVRNNQIVKSDLWSRGKAYIGHNRKKTMGALDDTSAHPFVVDARFAMVHNGTLFTHKQLADVDVDSEALAIHLAKVFKEHPKDYRAPLEEALGKVYGAYALAWYDQDADCVRLLRNKERPLSIIEAEGGWFFASEAPMAGWILSREARYDFTKLKYIPCAEHTLYTFDLKKNELRQEALVPKKSSVQSNNSGKTNTAGPNTAGKGMGTSTTIEASGQDFTNKDFVRLKKEWLGKRMVFEVDDYIEDNYPKSIEQHGEVEVCIMGQNPDIKFRHRVYVDINLDHFKMGGTLDFLDCKWSARVEKIEKTGGVAVFTMEAPKQVIKNILKLPSSGERNFLIDHLKGMTLEELNTEYEEKKHILNSWEVAAYSVARRDKENEGKPKPTYLYPSLVAAEKAAHVQGIHLTCSYDNERHVWTWHDVAGKVWYEDKSSIH
jgi:hypothetical protein